jgi:hypothetical protein
MARIRTIKPDFFRHELLQELEAAHPAQCVMLTFAGLWGHCDKAGRFEWRPRTLKLDILPFLPFDIARTLQILADAQLVIRYSVGGREYGHIPSFIKHQRIGGKEAQDPSRYPPPVDNSGEITGKSQGSTGETTGKQSGSQEGKEEGKEEGKGSGALSRASSVEKKDLNGGPWWKDRGGVEAMAEALGMRAKVGEEQGAFVSRLFASLAPLKCKPKAA